MRILQIILWTLIVPFSHTISQTMTKEQYINKHYKLAVEEMNLYNIPASITLAQGLLETNNGNSDLAIKANNHFGIKCQNSWTGMKYIKDDDKKDECFRVYATTEESYRDHSIFLLRPRYESLFKNDINDYKSWAYGLKAAGYATNPNYPLILIKFIEDFKLYEFDSYGINSYIKKIDTIKKINTIISVDTLKKNKPLDTIPPIKIIRKSIANNLNFIIVDSNFNVDIIAKEHKIPRLDLLNYNELDNEQSVTIGQNFFLEKKLKENKIGTHEVKKGESLYDISQKYGITLETLKKLNRIGTWEQPLEGEILNLQSPRNTYLKTRTYFELLNEKRKLMLKQKEVDERISTINTIKSTSIIIPENKPKTIIHKVAAKENVFRIAKLYGCKPHEIYEWNNLKVDEDIKQGQEIKIILPK